MATNPLTASFDSAIAETDRQIIATPGTGKFIRVLEGEISVDAPAKVMAHFDTGDVVTNRVMGGFLAGGGGTSSVKDDVKGPVDKGLFYTSSAAVNQTVLIRYEIRSI